MNTVSPIGCIFKYLTVFVDLICDTFLSYGSLTRCASCVWNLFASYIWISCMFRWILFLAFWRLCLSLCLWEFCLLVCTHAMWVLRIEHRWKKRTDSTQVVLCPPHMSFGACAHEHAHMHVYAYTHTMCIQ